MSYSAPRFLTVIIVLIAASASLFAQRDIVKDELEYLAAPSSIERALAVSRLVEIEEDISADLRVAYRFTGLEERLGLLKVARLRESDALLQQAAEALADENSTLQGVAREYLLTLPLDDLKPDTDGFDKKQARCWEAFKDYRLRRDVSRDLVEAYVMPGKFFGQFDDLRALDAGRLDNELLAVLTADPAFIEPLSEAALAHIEQDVPAERTLQTPWRRLEKGADALRPAMMYLHAGSFTEEIDKLRELYTDSGFRAALEVVAGVRAAAVRALAASDRAEELLVVLPEYYQTMLAFKPAAEYSDSIKSEELEIELELTLARLGDWKLLDARVSRLRIKIDQFDRLQGNLNLRPSSRPDLLAQNQIAHLLLRAGDPEKAESEWLASVRASRELMRQATGRNRDSLSSYLSTVYYNLACARSLQFKQSDGLESLKKAVENGYKDFSWILEDGDLDYLRRSPEFRDWFLDVAPPAVADQLRSDS